MKRGQSALEYLVTYGWAILAIVIIGGVLWYFGIFNPSQFAGDKQCGGFSAFTCGDFKVTAAGDMTIVLNNKVGGTITDVRYLNATGNVCAASVGANAAATCNVGGFVAAGATGTSFSRQAVTVIYTDARSSVVHTDTGFVAGKLE